jgi:hypothetical protein
MRHRRRSVGRALAGLGLALLLTGCPASPPPESHDAAPSSAPAPLPARPDGDPPASPRPLTRLQATVPLVDQPMGSVPVTAVGTPDGGALVVVTPQSRSDPLGVVTIDGGHRVTRSVAAPRLDPVWDAQLLPDGRLLISGEFRAGERGYGFEVVDPATGRSSRNLVIPFEEGTDVANGRSAVAPGGDTVYLFLSTFVEDRRLNLLVAADVATGRQLGGRDLFEEVRDVSVSAIQPFSVWMFARDEGGVELVFDGFPTESGRIVPTLLRYDDALEPVGRPAQLTLGQPSAETQAVARAPDGTIYMSAEALDGDLLFAVPPGGDTAGRLMALAGHTYDYALVVEPAQGWVLLPARDGVRAIDLVTGEQTLVDIGCGSHQQVRRIVPGHDAGAVLLGQCADPGPGTATVWFTGP